MLGVFVSASRGELIAVYCRKDGTVAPMYRKAVRTAKALFAAKYVGVTYAEARAALMRDAAKTGVKAPAKKEASPKVGKAA